MEINAQSRLWEFSASQTRAAAITVLCGAAAIWFAYFSSYTTDIRMLGFLLFAEILAVALWDYKQRFFPFLMLIFFFAGTGVPLASFWEGARWLVLGAGALAGLAPPIRECAPRLGKFHLLASFCVIAAWVSASASLYSQDALLKVLSLCLLFLYATFGMRASVVGNERQFFTRLLLFSELLTYVAAACYFLFHYGFFGNPNSLGAVMGVLVVPMTLWGVFVTQGTRAQFRQVVALGLALLLLASSHARAGILGACVSCALVCIALRRYRALTGLVAAGLAAATIVIYVAPIPEVTPTLSSTFIYKGHKDQGILGSRRSIWEQTMASVEEHPWFGTGFGTSATGKDATQNVSNFASAARDTREHGNSYLAILEWVGILGVWPFALLLFMLSAYVVKSLVIMRRMGTAVSPLVPLVGVVIAGLVHAGFEDWLFAAGYYLCVLFWALAFLLIDYAAAAGTVVRFPPDGAR